MAGPYRIGIIGLGGMGKGYHKVLAASDRYELAYVCDLDDEKLAYVRRETPAVTVTKDAEDLFVDESLDVVGIFTLADIRPRFLRRALATGKHVIAEKPIASPVAEEWALLKEIEASDRMVAVNLFNRSAWYHREIQAVIDRGEIGSLGVLRVHHMTPGLMPTEGHQPEGPPFHDCGMHYIDVARWYAGAEYQSWHAQGLRMWGWEDPWWVSAHGSFENGVVFDVTQGFVYGQLAKEKVNACGLEAIGSLGVIRMRHDFETVTIEVRGVTESHTKEGPYGGKKLDVLCETFARSLDAGTNLGFPEARDSVIASQVSQEMLEAATVAAPVIGSPEEMERILAHRAALRANQGNPFG